MIIKSNSIYWRLLTVCSVVLSCLILCYFILVRRVDDTILVIIGHFNSTDSVSPSCFNQFRSPFNERFLLLNLLIIFYLLLGNLYLCSTLRWSGKNSWTDIIIQCVLWFSASRYFLVHLFLFACNAFKWYNLIGDAVTCVGNSLAWLCSPCQLEIPIIDCISLSHLWHWHTSDIWTLISKWIENVPRNLWHLLLSLNSRHSQERNGWTNWSHLRSELTRVWNRSPREVAIHLCQIIRSLAHAATRSEMHNVWLLFLELVDWLTCVATLLNCMCSTISVASVSCN